MYFSMAFWAPAMRALMSAPATAMGSRPTAVSTEKRPPHVVGHHEGLVALFVGQLL